MFLSKKQLNEVIVKSLLQESETASEVFDFHSRVPIDFAGVDEDSFKSLKGQNYFFAFIGSGQFDEEFPWAKQWRDDYGLSQEDAYELMVANNNFDTIIDENDIEALQEFADTIRDDIMDEMGSIDRFADALDNLQNRIEASKDHHDSIDADAEQLELQARQKKFALGRDRYRVSTPGFIGAGGSSMTIVVYDKLKGEDAVTFAANDFQRKKNSINNKLQGIRINKIHPFSEKNLGGYYTEVEAVDQKGAFRMIRKTLGDTQ